MSRTRVKICGITRLEDAAASVRAGADAIGLVFDPQSPRYVLPEQAADIARNVGPFVTVVALFVNAETARVREIIGRVRVALLQFHGSETPEQCRVFNLPYIKAVRMHDGVDLHAAARDYGDAAGLLLDAFVPHVPGGSGQRFDWTRVPRDLAKPVIVAGGLNPENVAEAVRSVRPYAVDVSSGVEAAKGIKDAGRIDAFVRAVKDVE